MVQIGEIIRLEPSIEQITFLDEYLKNFKFQGRGFFEGSQETLRLGYLAEILVCDFLKKERPKQHTRHDDGTDVMYKGKKMDIKTKIRNVPFKEHFVHGVSKYQLNNGAEGFIFCNIIKSSNIVEICGYIKKEDFLSHSIFLRKGDKELRDDGSEFIVSFDVYNIKQCHLLPVTQEQEKHQMNLSEFFH